jgi:hypothetical protein
MRRVVIMRAMIRGGVVVIGSNRPGRNVRSGRRQLQSHALAPRRGAGDKRKRERQSQGGAKSTTHRVILTGLANARQQIIRWLPPIR